MARKKYIRRRKPNMKPCVAWPEDVCAAVTQSLELYRSRRYKYLRFGITDDPQQQYERHRYRDGIHWTHMYVCFTTSSVTDVRRAVAPLSTLDDYTSNVLRFNESLFDPPRNYYIYILAGKRRKSHWQGISIPELISEQRMTIQQRIGIALTTLRKRRGMTRQQLAERACINAGYLLTIERGQRNVSPVILERISLALDMKVSDFFLQVEREE